jgi:hypothetical protein
VEEAPFLTGGKVAAQPLQLPPWRGAAMELGSSSPLSGGASKLAQPETPEEVGWRE